MYKILIIPESLKQLWQLIYKIFWFKKISVLRAFTKFMICIHKLKNMVATQNGENILIPFCGFFAVTYMKYIVQNVRLVAIM